MSYRDLGRQSRRAAALLKAMGNPHRFLVLCELAAAGERCVGDLEKVVGLSQSALSQHLARLRHSKLVKTRREAQTIYYSIAGREVIAVIDLLSRLFANGKHSARAA